MKKPKVQFNFIDQAYKGITVRLIDRGYVGTKAKRFLLIPPLGAVAMTNQNVWIPNKHLTEDGTIKAEENIDYVFRKAQHQLELAGYLEPIVGIKRRTQKEGTTYAGGIQS